MGAMAVLAVIGKQLLAGPGALEVNVAQNILRPLGWFQHAQ